MRRQNTSSGLLNAREQVYIHNRVAPRGVASRGVASRGIASCVVASSDLAQPPRRARKRHAPPRLLPLRSAQPSSQAHSRQATRVVYSSSLADSTASRTIATHRATAPPTATHRANAPLRHRTVRPCTTMPRTAALRYDAARIEKDKHSLNHGTSGDGRGRLKILSHAMHA